MVRTTSGFQQETQPSVLALVANIAFSRNLFDIATSHTDCFNVSFFLPFAVVAISFCNLSKKSWRRNVTARKMRMRTAVVNSHLHPLHFDAPWLCRLVERTLKPKNAVEAAISFPTSHQFGGRSYSYIRYISHTCLH